MLLSSWNLPFSVVPLCVSCHSSISMHLNFHPISTYWHNVDQLLYNGIYCVWSYHSSWVCFNLSLSLKFYFIMVDNISGNSYFFSDLFSSSIAHDFHNTAVTIILDLKIMTFCNLRDKPFLQVFVGKIKKKKKENKYSIKIIVLQCSVITWLLHVVSCYMRESYIHLEVMMIQSPNNFMQQHLIKTLLVFLFIFIKKLLK